MENNEQENELLKAVRDEYELKLTEQKEMYEQKLKEQKEEMEKDKVSTIRAIISGRDVSLVEGKKVEEKKEKSWYQEELDKTRKNLKINKEEK